MLHSTSNLPPPKSSRDPAHPVDEETWNGWFGEDGRPKIRLEEMKREIFRRGVVAKSSTRQKIWPFILGVHAWDVNAEERDAAWKAKQ